MVTDLTIGQAFGEIRSFMQEVSEGWYKIRTVCLSTLDTREAKVLARESTEFVRRAQVGFCNLIDRAQGTPAEVMSALSPYVLEYLDTLRLQCLEVTSPCREDYGSPYHKKWGHYGVFLRLSGFSDISMSIIRSAHFSSLHCTKVYSQALYYGALEYLDVSDVYSHVSKSILSNPSLTNLKVLNVSGTSWEIRAALESGRFDRLEALDWRLTQRHSSYSPDDVENYLLCLKIAASLPHLSYFKADWLPELNTFMRDCTDPVRYPGYLGFTKGQLKTLEMRGGMYMSRKFFADLFSLSEDAYLSV